MWKALIFLLPLLLTLAACQAQVQPFLIAPIAIETAKAEHDLPSTPLPEAAPIADSDAVASALPQDDPYALLLALAFSYWDQLREEAIPPKLLLGRVPANLPFSIEMPEKTTIIGSLTDQDEVWGQIYFTTTLTSEVAVENFKATMIDQGLVELTGNTLVSDVFALSGNWPPGFAVCTQDRTNIIWVRSLSFEDGTTTISIRMERSNSGGLCQSMEYDPVAASTLEPLPTLIAPTGVVPLEQGSSYGFGRVWHTSELESLLPLAQLAAAYDAQLADVGWELLEQGNNGSAAWSLWMLHDDEENPWGASLYVFANPVSENRYTAILRADRQK